MHVCTLNSCSLISVWSQQSPRRPLSSASPPRWSHWRPWQRISVCGDTMKQDWNQTLYLQNGFLNKKIHGISSKLVVVHFTQIKFSQGRFCFESQFLYRHIPLSLSYTKALEYSTIIAQKNNRNMQKCHMLATKK